MPLILPQKESQLKYLQAGLAILTKIFDTPQKSVDEFQDIILDEPITFDSTKKFPYTHVILAHVNNQLTYFFAHMPADYPDYKPLQAGVYCLKLPATDQPTSKGNYLVSAYATKIWPAMIQETLKIISENNALQQELLYANNILIEAGNTSIDFHLETATIKEMPLIAKLTDYDTIVHVSSASYPVYHRLLMNIYSLQRFCAANQITKENII